VHLFSVSCSSTVLLFQNATQGFAVLGNMFALPVYLQNVRGYTPVDAGVILISAGASQGLGSIAGGYLISQTGRFKYLLLGSQAIWLLGSGLQLLIDRDTAIWLVCVVQALNGIGYGCVFKPSTSAHLSQNRSDDRAVLCGLRNFLRFMGGAVGVVVSGTLLNNILEANLAEVLDFETIKQITSQIFAFRTMAFGAEDDSSIKDAYMTALHVLFIVFFAIVVVDFLASFLVTDKPFVIDGLDVNQDPQLLRSSSLTLNALPEIEHRETEKEREEGTHSGGEEDRALQV